MVNNRIMAFIKKELEKFTLQDFNPGKAWQDALTIFLSWSIPSFLFVALVKYFASFRPVSYLEEALSQGVGPTLWNVMGCLGLALFFLSLTFPKIRLFAIFANHVLVNTFAIGCLTFGILLGQIAFSFSEWSVYAENWRIYLFTPVVAALLLSVVLLNLVIWYFSYLIQWGSEFRVKISQISVYLRFFAGSVFLFLPLWLLWIEK